MNRFLLLSLVLLGPLTGFAQTYFNNRYSVTPAFTGGTDVLPVPNGYWLAGQCNNALTPGAGALYLQRLDSAGRATQPAKIWAKRQTTFYTGGVGGSSFWPTGTSGFKLAGTVVDSTGRRFGKLWCFDAQGDSLWTRTYRAAFDLFIYGSCATADGGAALTGLVDSALNSSRTDVLLLRTDSSGRELWRQTYHMRRTDMGFYVYQTADGGFLITGFTTHWFGTGPAGQPYDSDGLVIKTDSLGRRQWLTTFGGPYREAAGPARPAADGGYVVCGHWTDTMLNNDAQSKPALFWLDSAGTVQRRRTYGPGQAGTGLYALHPLADGGYVMAGQIGYPTNAVPVGNGFQQGLVLRVCADGDSVWYRTYKKLTGGYSQNYLRDLKPTADGGFVAAGFLHVRAPDTGTPDAWLFKVDQYGYLQAGGAVPTLTCRPTGVSSEPVGEELLVYPNPSADGRFVVQAPTGTALIVTDALGRVVWRGTSTEAETRLDLSRQPAGLYLLRLMWPDGRTMSCKLVR